MIKQLIIGCAVTCVTLSLQVLCIGAAVAWLKHIGPRLSRLWMAARVAVVLACTVASIVVGVALCCIVWTIVFMRLGLFDDGETAVYFTIVTFTTLGYGDVTLDSQWRFLSGLTATNGLIAFGINTAFLVEAMSALVRSGGRHATQATRREDG